MTSVYVVEHQQLYPKLDKPMSTVMHVASTLPLALVWARTQLVESNWGFRSEQEPWWITIIEEQLDANNGTKIIVVLDWNGNEQPEGKRPDYAAQQEKSFLKRLISRVRRTT